MPRGLIVYFSQGGTTAQVAERIALGLRDSGYLVDSHNLRQGAPPSPSGYDLFGVGTPVYFYRLPFNVDDYLRHLPPINAKPVFGFLLYGTYHFEAPEMLRRALAGKGGREVGLYRSRGDDLYISYLKHGYRFSAGHPDVGELLAAEMFGRQVAARAAGARYDPPPAEAPAPAIYRFERFATNRHFVRHLYSRCFRLDKRKCTRCGICQKGCPTGNIGETAAGYPKWGRDCILCLMCEEKCPREAITSATDWPLFWPFFRYNVTRAAADPAISHARVRLRRGKIFPEAD